MKGGCGWQALCGVAALGMALPSCHAPTPAARPSAVAGYVTAGYSALWPSRAVPVCWEGGESDAPEVRLAVQDAVAAAYSQDDLGFSFFGWGDCTAAAPGVRVALADVVPRVAGYGAWLNGVTAGVTLNALFTLSGPAPCQTAAGRTACLKTYAVHEFGHVLGLRHEANRPDSGCPAQDQTGGLGEAGAFAVDPYDPDSVMNYCRLDADLQVGAVTALSAGDVGVLRQYYGRELVFPTADLGAACARDAGAWDSVGACCNVPAAGWQPAAAVPYRACAMPALAAQTAACAVALGQWVPDGACCRNAMPAPNLPHWRTFYRQCLP